MVWIVCMDEGLVVWGGEGGVYQFFVGLYFWGLEFLIRTGRRIDSVDLGCLSYVKKQRFRLTLWLFVQVIIVCY